jgi:hypothetical protein
MSAACRKQGSWEMCNWRSDRAFQVRSYSERLATSEAGSSVRFTHLVSVSLSRDAPSETVCDGTLGAAKGRTSIVECKES